MKKAAILRVNSEILDKLKTIQNDSIAKKRKVGALIYNFDNNEILSYGYNHNSFVNDNCENTEGETFDTVIHAESDCLFKILTNTIALQRVSNSNKLSMFVTFSPCIECSKLIVQSGFISDVFILKEHEKNFRNPIVKESLSALEFLEKNNINVWLYDSEIDFFELQNQILNNDNIYGIYHSADLDGFMSGYLLSKYLVQNKNNLFGYNYESESVWMSEIIQKLDKGEKVKIYFGDVTPNNSFLDKVCNYIISGTLEIIILDHHLNELKRIQNYSTLININFTKLNISGLSEDSGCEIVLKYIINKQPEVPISIKYRALCDIIGTHDTWRFDFSKYIFSQNTKDKQYFLNLITYLKHKIKTYSDFTEFVDNQLVNENLDSYFSKLALKGKELIESKIKQCIFKLSIGYFIKTKDNQLLFLVENEYPEFYTLECIKTYVKKLIENNCIENYKYKNFIYISYNTFLNSQEMKFHVRSYINDLDEKYFQAIDIAKKFENGGGHNDAAGFTLSLKHGFQFIENFKDFEYLFLK